MAHRTRFSISKTTLEIFFMNPTSMSTCIWQASLLVHLIFIERIVMARWASEMAAKMIWWTAFSEIDILKCGPNFGRTTLPSVTRWG
jgi:hypothetical protein